MSAPNKIVVVVGATGTQGGNVVKELLLHPEYHVRAITRNPSKESAKKLATAGVEVVEADLNDVSSLKLAFSGAFAIYAYTNFFDTPFVNELVFQQSEVLEAAQGRNLAFAAASTPSLEHYLWSSTPNAAEQSNGKYKNVRFFNSKSHVTNVIKVEFPDLWKKTTEIWIGFMYENFVKLNAFAGPKFTREGHYELAVNMKAHSVLGSVSCGDLGKLVHFVLQSHQKYYTRTIGLVKEELRESERLEIWGKSVGRQVKFQELTADKYMARIEALGVPHTAAQGFAELFELFSDMGNAYSGAEVLQARDLLPESTLVSWKEYVKQQDWSAILEHGEGAGHGPV